MLQGEEDRHGRKIEKARMDIRNVTRWRIYWRVSQIRRAKWIDNENSSRGGKIAAGKKVYEIKKKKKENKTRQHQHPSFKPTNI